MEPIEISIPEYGYEPYWRYNGNKKIILTSENKMQQETIKELEQNIVIYRYSDKNRFELYGFLIDGVKVPVSELGEYIFNKSVTITPIFKALYYEVSIHYDDKNNKSYSNTIRINDKKKKLEQKDIPDEEGIHYYYNDNPDKFLGWVINDGDKVYSREELLNMEIDKDMNIKPKNEKQKYTVKFSAQGEKHLHFEDKEFITKDAKLPANIVELLPDVKADKGYYSNFWYIDPQNLSKKAISSYKYQLNHRIYGNYSIDLWSVDNPNFWMTKDELKNLIIYDNTTIKPVTRTIVYFDYRNTDNLYKLANNTKEKHPDSIVEYKIYPTSRTTNKNISAFGEINGDVIYDRSVLDINGIYEKDIDDDSDSKGEFKEKNEDNITYFWYHEYEDSKYISPSFVRTGYRILFYSDYWNYSIHTADNDRQVVVRLTDDKYKLYYAPKVDDFLQYIFNSEAGKGKFNFLGWEDKNDKNIFYTMEELNNHTFSDEDAKYKKYVDIDSYLSKNKNLHTIDGNTLVDVELVSVIKPVVLFDVSSISEYVDENLSKEININRFDVVSEVPQFKMKSGYKIKQWKYTYNGKEIIINAEDLAKTKILDSVILTPIIGKENLKVTFDMSKAIDKIITPIQNVVIELDDNNTIGDENKEKIPRLQNKDQYKFIGWSAIEGNEDGLIRDEISTHKFDSSTILYPILKSNVKWTNIEIVPPAPELLKELVYYKGDKPPKDLKVIFKNSESIKEVKEEKDKGIDTSVATVGKVAEVKVIYQNGSSRIVKVKYKVKDRLPWIDIMVPSKKTDNHKSKVEEDEDSKAKAPLKEDEESKAKAPLKEDEESKGKAPLKEDEESKAKAPLKEDEESKAKAPLKEDEDSKAKASLKEVEALDEKIPSKEIEKLHLKDTSKDGEKSLEEKLSSEAVEKIDSNKNDNKTYFKEEAKNKKEIFEQKLIKTGDSSPRMAYITSIIGSLMAILSIKKKKNK